MRRHVSARHRLLLATSFAIGLAPALILAEQPKPDVFEILDLDGNGTVTAEEMRLPAVRQKFDLIVGAKQGSKEMLLSSVYGIGRPADTIPYDVYLQFIATKDDQGKPLKGEFAEMVNAAVPFCLGDSYRGFRVIATNSLYFTLPYGGDEKPLKIGFAAGRNMRDDNSFEAVVGATAANKLGLKVGDRFATEHGLVDPTHVHPELFEVVGILQPTSSADDRSLFVNFEGFYLLEGHSAKDDGEKKAVNKRLPLTHREVTLVGISSKHDIFSLQLLRHVNRDSKAKAIIPILEHDLLTETPNELLDTMLLFRMTADRPMQGVTRQALKRAGRESP